MCEGRGHAAAGATRSGLLLRMGVSLDGGRQWGCSLQKVSWAPDDGGCGRDGEINVHREEKKAKETVAAV